jgi:hypothetical protein
LGKLALQSPVVPPKINLWQKSGHTGSGIRRGTNGDPPQP